MEEFYEKIFSKIYEGIFKGCLRKHYAGFILDDTLRMDKIEVGADSGLSSCLCLNHGVARIFEIFMYSTDFSYSKKLSFIKMKIKEQVSIDEKQRNNRSLKTLLLLPICFRRMPRYLHCVQYQRTLERKRYKIERAEIKETKKEQELYKTVKICLGNTLNKDIISIVNSFLFTNINISYSDNKTYDYKCKCGSLICNSSKKAHKKSKKHIKYKLENKT